MTLLSLHGFPSDPRLIQDLPGRKGLKFFSEVGTIFNLMLVPLFPAPAASSCLEWCML